MRPEAAIRRLERRGPELCVIAIFAVSAAIHLWWLHRFRAGFPLDIDESRYIAFGLALRDGLAADGPAGAWHAWAAQHDFGPLQPLVSVPLFLVFGRTVTTALATPLVFLALLLAASYGVGARLTSRWGGVLAAGVVATAPGVIDFSRSYQFPIAAAALLTPRRGRCWPPTVSHGAGGRSPSGSSSGSRCSRAR